MDVVMMQIGHGLQLGQSGDRAAARRELAEVWRRIGREAGDPLHRCALAHAMADGQEDVRDELVWDLRALEAADAISDERASGAGLSSARALYPSLHLNLGECYRKVGDLDRAREQLRRGQSAVAALADDGYGQMIRGGLDRLAERLGSATS